MERLPAGHVPASTSVIPPLESEMNVLIEYQRFARPRVSIVNPTFTDHVSGNRITRATLPITNPISIDNVNANGINDAPQHVMQFSGSIELSGSVIGDTLHVQWEYWSDGNIPTFNEKEGNGWCVCTVLGVVTNIHTGMKTMLVYYTILYVEKSYVTML